MLFYLEEHYREFKNATAFCDNAVVVGKSGADLLQRAKKMGGISMSSHSSSPEELKIIFGIVFPLPLCHISLNKGIVTEKHMEQID